MKRQMRGFLQRTERNQANLVRFSHFFERPANARITRQPLAAIGRPFKGGNDDGHREAPSNKSRDWRYSARMWHWPKQKPDPPGITQGISGAWLSAAGVVGITLGVVKIAFLSEGWKWSVSVALGVALLVLGVRLLVQSER
jgi:hypothetical protein